MYPDEIVFGLTLYEIFILIGIIAALVIFRIYADKKKFPAALENLVLIDAVLSVVAGYGSAVLFQAVFDALETGTFAITGSTGSTFYGGLIGGGAFFLAVYFAVGALLFRKKENCHLSMFPELMSIAACSITAAHGFGRIGCLMAGCCHGAETDSWIGIWMGDAKYVPIQLFEAIFLFLLCALFSVRVFKSRHREVNNLALYGVLYGIWRFIIEFFRADDRGAFFIPGLTPGQGISILLIGAGLLGVLIPVVLLKTRPDASGNAAAKEPAKDEEAEEPAAEDAPADAGPEEASDSK